MIYGFAVLMSICKKMSVSKYFGECHLVASEFSLGSIEWRFWLYRRLIVSRSTFQFRRRGKYDVSSSLCIPNTFFSRIVVAKFCAARC